MSLNREKKKREEIEIEKENPAQHPKPQPNPQPISLSRGPHPPRGPSSPPLRSAHQQRSPARPLPAQRAHARAQLLLRGPPAAAGSRDPPAPRVDALTPRAPSSATPPVGWPSATRPAPRSPGPPTRDSTPTRAPFPQPARPLPPLTDAWTPPASGSTFPFLSPRRATARPISPASSLGSISRCTPQSPALAL